MKDISLILKTLSLADSEIATYLAALEHGPSTVIDLAKITHLSRQATYLAIQDLTKRSLMSSVVLGKKKLFNAEHPSKLLAYARRREAEMRDHLEDLERSIPELELQMGGERPVVKVYEGKEGIRAIIEELKKAGHGPYKELADLEALYKVLTPAELLPLRTTLKQLGAKGRGLYTGLPSQKVFDVDRHMLPDEYRGFKTNLTIYADRIAMVTFEGKMTSVIIESKTLARTLGILYDLAFETAKKFPTK